MVGFAYYDKGEVDSCLYYLDRCIPFIPGMSQEQQSVVYGNLGILYASLDRVKCNHYIRKIALDKPSMLNYIVLYEYYQAKGNLDSANHYIDKALPLSPVSNQIDMLNRKVQNLSTLDGGATTLVMAQTCHVLDSLQLQLKNDNVYAVQKKYDNAIVRQNMEKKMSGIIYSGVVLFLLFVLAVLLLVLHHRNKTHQTILKMREKELLLESYQRQLVEYQSGAMDAQKSAEERQHIINSLRGEIRMLKKDKVDNLGKQLYDSILNGATAIHWKRKDFEAFNTYFRMIDVEVVSLINERYNNVTATQFFMLILHYTGKTDEEIKTIMGMSPGSFRTAKSRIHALVKS